MVNNCGVNGYLTEISHFFSLVLQILIRLSLTLLQVKSVVEGKREEYVLDSRLADCPKDEIHSVFSIALMCLEAEPSRRPTMIEVLKMLERIKPEEFNSGT